MIADLTASGKEEEGEGGEDGKVRRRGGDNLRFFYCTERSSAITEGGECWN